MPFQASKMGSVSLMFRSTLRTSSTRSLSPTARALSYWREVSKSGLTITSEPLLGQTWASVQLLTRWWVSLLDQVTYLSNEIRLCYSLSHRVRDMQHSDWLQPPRRTQHQDNQRSEQHKWGQQRPQLGDRHRGLRPRVYGGGRSFLQEHILVFSCGKIVFTNTLSDRHGGQYCSPSPWWPASPDDWKD